MLNLVADVNIQGQFRIMESIMRSEQWSDFWVGLKCRTLTFKELQLQPKAKDNVVWSAIRKRDAILITANRNSEGPDSLGAMLSSPDARHAFPVLTISDPKQLRKSRIYMHDVVESLLEILTDIENMRGTGRLYLPLR